MTNEELEQYNQLSPEGQDAYNMAMKHHPEWSHQQAFTYAVIVTQPIDLPIDRTPWEEMKEIYQAMVKKADDYLKTNFPTVYSAVKEIFSRIYNKISSAISMTWNEIVDFFSNL